MGRAGEKDRGLKEHPPGSGIWWVDIYHEGKRVRDKVGRKSDARRRLLELREELRQGRRRRDPVKLGVLLQEYLPELLRTNRRERDVRRYVAEFDAEFGRRAAADLTVGDVQDWKERRLARPSSPATVNRILAVLRRVLELAVRDHRLVWNVAAQAGRMPGERPRARRLTPEELARLRVEMGPDWPLVEFALETGMRQGLQFGLRREWVDLESARISVPSQPVVGLTPRAVEILRQALAEQATAWVFPGERRSGPLNPRNFCRRVFHPALQRAGIRDFTWQDLRHGIPGGR